MAKQVFPCTVKTGPNAGGRYCVERKINWGKPAYSVDVERTGWHSSVKQARIAAEQAGYIWEATKSGLSLIGRFTVAA